jgi:hypothetical protein
MRITDVRHAPKGCLIQWTMDNGTVLRTRADVDAAVARTSRAWERELLCEVRRYLGQRCTLVGHYPEDRPVPTYLVRFADGTELHVMSTDALFD